MPDSELVLVRVSLGKIEGILLAKHQEYDRRLSALEARIGGGLTKVTTVISSVIAGVSLLVVVGSQVAWE